MCLGAGLAPSETFLFFTAILQWFHVLPMGSLADTHLTRVHWTGKRAPSLPALPGGPLRSGSAIFCSRYQTSLPLWSIKALNCRWRHLLSQKERGSQMCAALR